MFWTVLSGPYCSVPSSDRLFLHSNTCRGVGYCSKLFVVSVLLGPRTGFFTLADQLSSLSCDCLPVGSIVMSDGYEVKERRPFEDTRRTLHFWRRASGVYFAYKAAQARAAFLSKAKGWDADRLKEEFWKPHHTWYFSLSHKKSQAHDRDARETACE